LATVKINALPQFKQLWEKHRYKVLVSGRASGKSVAAADAAITFMVKYPVKILQVRQFMNSIADSSYQQVVDRIEDHGIEHLFEIQKNKIICTTTGAEMIFRGLERNITSVKSIANVDIVIAEEAETINAESWRILIPTIMRNKGAEMWILLNPRLPSDATAFEFLSDHPPKGTVYMRANYEENPYLPQSMLDDIAQMKEHDYKRYLHVYRGQFLDVGDMKVFPYELLKAAINRTTNHSDELKIAALDVARFGSDSSVLCIRHGNVVQGFNTWKGKNTVELTRLVADIALAEDIKTLVVDAGGLGAGVVDQLESMLGNTCRILEFTGASKADDSRYYNARAETHFKAKEWLDTGCIPVHDDLVAEASSIEYKFAPNHKILIEKKEDFKKRTGGTSPDTLDAFSMTFYSQANIKKLDTKKLFKRGPTQWT